MSLPSGLINFGEWLPDLPALNNPGMVLVQNALPTVTSYTQVQEPEYRGGAMGERVRNAHWCISGGGIETAVFAGTENSLYRQSGTLQWDNVDKTGGYGDSIERWDLAAFGRRMIAVTNGQVPQYYDVGTSTNFADLPNAPSATCVGLIRDFVMLGDIDNLGENYIQWSGFNNSEAWTPSRSTQSDFQPLASNGGRVQAITSGEVGYIFLENSVYRAVYVGPPTIFRFDEFAPGRGTFAPKSVIRIGPYIYYYDSAGFYRLDARNGQFTSIGHNKVDRWFKREVPPPCVRDMQVSVDQVRKFVVWAFCLDEGQELYTRLLVYHYELNRWCLITVDVDTIASLPAPSASLDDLDTILSPGDDAMGDAIPANVDEQSISVDSELYSGGTSDLIIFSPNHVFGALSGGTALEARFLTAEYGAFMNDRLYTNRQRMYIGSADGVPLAELSIMYRDNLTDTPSITNPHAMNQNGVTEARRRARFQQFRLDVSDGFDDVLGLEVFQA